MKGPWVIPEGQRNFPDMEFIYVPMPPYAGTENVFAAESGWGEVVNVNAAPEIKAAAWKFIDFMTQPDNLRVWNLSTYTLPSLKSMQNDPQILEVAPCEGLLRRPALRQVGRAGTQPRPLLAVDSTTPSPLPASASWTRRRR